MTPPQVDGLFSSTRMAHLTIHAPTRSVEATIALPTSKSVANRALLCAALAGDLSVVRDRPDADDTRILHDLLSAREPILRCGLGGTTLRFALAWAAVQEGREHFVTAGKELLARPHQPLVMALCTLGARIETTMSGFMVHGLRLKGGEVEFDRPLSSQYISALMLVAPTMEKSLSIHWKGGLLSRPYVDMTAQVLRHFGAEVTMGQDGLTVGPGDLKPRPIAIPPDRSAAAFWYQIVALACKAHVVLPGMVGDGWQGDARMTGIMAPLVETIATADGIELVPTRKQDTPPGTIDLRDAPDLFPALACTFAGRGIPVTFTGLDNLHLKESDRVQVMADQLQAWGASVAADGSTFHVKGGRVAPVKEVVLDPHGDHRMAMALAPLALMSGVVRIDHPEVVAKSYPAYWRHLEAAGFRIER